MNFSVSDKVVYIGGDDDRSNEYIASQFERLGPELVLGAVYVVEGVTWYDHWTPGVFGLILVGHSALWKGVGENIGYNSLAFRRLAEVQAESRAKATRAYE
jgi:hypothetical protein